MYKDILFPVDLNHESSWKKALPTAVEYCRAFGARLHVVTVLPDFGMPIVANYFPADFEAKAREGAKRHLHEFVSQHVPDDIGVQHIVAEGAAYKEILRVAEEVGVDLILMASHNPSIKDHLLGPTSERVVRHFPHSVLIVRD
jgi:nucleotide-binding universal stress UspA family protein